MPSKKIIALSFVALLLFCFATVATAAGYLANTKSGKYHISTCRTLKHPNAPHFVPYNTAQECEDAGYTPCKVCLR